MSWIKIRTNLATDPAVAAIGMRVKMHPRQVVGCLVAVWCWADPLTADGWVPHATARLIDDIAGKRGFAEALASVNWLTVEADGIRFPKWDRHHSQSAKARAGEAERKRLQRLDGALQQSPDTPSGKMSGHLPDRSLDQRRGEERREENTVEPPPGMPRTEQAAVTACALIGVPEDFVRETYQRASAVGFIDTQGRVLRNWPSYVKKSHTDAQQRGFDQRQTRRPEPAIREVSA